MQALFGSAGIGNAMVAATTSAARAVDGTIPASLSSITESNRRLTKRMAEVQTRVDARREALIARFTSMELAMNRLQQQGNSLASTMTGLNGSR